MDKLLHRILTGLMLLALLAAIAPCALAAQELTLGEYNYDFFSESSGYTEELRSFTPSKSGEYVITTSALYDSFAEVVGQTELRSYNTFANELAHVYRLTAGTTYQIRHWKNPNGERVSEYIFRMDELRQAHTLTLDCTTLTGQRDESHSISVMELYPNYWPMDSLKWSSSDSKIVSIEYTSDHTCGIRLNAVGTATVTLSVGGATASCTVTVEKATGEWDSYPVWPAGQSKVDLTLAPDTWQSYTFTPAQSGKYVSWCEGGIHEELRPVSPSVITNVQIGGTSKGYYSFYDLIAGETYILTLVPGLTDRPQSGTFYFEKVKPASGVSFEAVDGTGQYLYDASKLTGYVGGYIVLNACSVPDYLSALTDQITFTSSDNSLLSMDDWGYRLNRKVTLNKAGSCDINVRIGDARGACDVTVLPSPVLALGQSQTLRFQPGGFRGVTCLFTPEVSQNYTFALSSKGGMGEMCQIKGVAYSAIYGSGTLSGYLEAGRTYEIVLDIYNADYTVTVRGTGSETPDVNDPGMGGPADPSEPTDPAQPSDPFEPTGPSQPADPSAPTEPVQPAPTVDPEDVAQLLGGSYAGGAIRVEQTGSLALSPEALDQLVLSGARLEAQIGKLTVELDHSALAAITAQATGPVSLLAEPMSPKDLSPAQREGLDGETPAAILCLELVSGDQKIHSFSGGQATVTVPFQSPQGTEGKDHCVYYLSPDGQLEKVPTTYSDGTLTFRTGHFSQYVILHQPTGPSAPQGQAAPDLLAPILCVLAAVLVVAGGATLLLTRKKQR